MTEINKIPVAEFRIDDLKKLYRYDTYSILPFIESLDPDHETVTLANFPNPIYFTHVTARQIGKPAEIEMIEIGRMIITELFDSD